MHPAAEDLAELPGVVAHISGVDPVHRRLDDHRRRAVPGPCGPASTMPRDVLGKAGYVESAVLMPTFM